MTNGAATSTANSKKLLICAPSNAAVDELVLRFKDGVRLTSGQDKKINVVRLGRSEKINPQVLEVTLEELVSARLNKAAGNSENQRQKTQELMMEHKEVSRKLNEAHDKQNEAEQKKDTATMNALEDEIFALRRRKKELSTQIDLAKDKEQNASRQNDLEKKRVEQQILDEAHILCATLSASGHDRFQNLSLEFETVIVDEAAQCTELSALIPLKYGAAKCILVGDPKQLPPTTFMDQKLNFQYEQSLFVRMQNNSPQDVHLLDTQYRMHPEISAFPSQVFYESRLLDGDGMAKLREKPWHADPMLGPYRFFDVQGQQSSSGSSLTNMKEIDAAMRLFNKLIAACGSYDFSGKIGIITPYKAQFNAMKRRFQDEYGKSILDTIEFNTTDAFQGRECEIIIFSCVRANEGSIGFLNDYRRMNVGLTRAKCSLWVLGHAKSLVNGKFWRMMIEDAQRRNRISPALDIGKAKPPSVNGAYRPVQDHATRLNYEDGDTVMGGNSGVNSSNASRRSSASSMSSNARPAPTGPSSNSRPIPTGPAADRVKKENIKPIKRESNGDNDIDMQDVFDSDTTVKSESKDGKPALVKQEHRVAAPGPPPKATGAGAGYMVPPPKGPAQMPVKRKKPGNGALLENKRPKKN
jgi:senataxin